MALLLREAIGDRLRHARTNQRRTLREVSRAARVSLGYLSEVERGRKEASSELLSAICHALELPLSQLLYNVATDMDSVDGVLSAPAGSLATKIDTIPADETPAQRQPEATVSDADGRSLPMMVGDLRIQPALSHRIDGPVTGKRGGGVLVA